MIANNFDFFQMDMSKDTLFRGEFEVVKDLIAAFPDGDASKRMCDKVKISFTSKKATFVFKCGFI